MEDGGRLDFSGGGNYLPLDLSPLLSQASFDHNNNVSNSSGVSKHVDDYTPVHLNAEWDNVQDNTLGFAIDHRVLLPTVIHMQHMRSSQGYHLDCLRDSPRSRYNRSRAHGRSWQLINDQPEERQGQLMTNQRRVDYSLV